MGDHPLDRFEFGDGFAELLSFHGVSRRLFESRPRDAHRDSTYADPASLQDAEGIFKGAIELAEEVLLGHPHTFQTKLRHVRSSHAELVLHADHDEPRSFSLHNKGRDTAASEGRIGRSQDNINAGRRPLSREELFSVYHP